MNANNIKQAFNNEIKSFNTAIRFVFETSKAAPVKTPAMPEKDDNSAGAKQLRKDAKQVAKNNELISDCKQIVDTFNITANDLKSKAIKTLRDKVLARAPRLSAEGYTVKFVKLDGILKDTEGYKDTFKVVPENWIDTIISATLNTDGVRIEGLQVTVPPVVKDGEIIEAASGDLVNANGDVIESAKIFARWNELAMYNNIANRAGNEVKELKFNELKSEGGRE